MGPLSSVKVLEIAGIGPGPMCAMLLADLGAEVIRIDRLQASNLGIIKDPKKDVLMRGRRSIAVDLKSPEGIETVLKLVEQSDVITEGFRPGVMERLGLGPDVCLARNPKLIYGRMTGWGQYGPLAQSAGHDINYISITGALNSFGREGEAPVPPLNLVGDFGGGALYLAMGILAGVIEAKSSGKGQVVDCAMTDGSASLMGMFYGMKGMGKWSEDRGTNLLDGGSHFYNVYKTKDDNFVSIGSIESKFYRELLEKTGLIDDASLPKQMDGNGWGLMKEKLTAIFLTKTRSEWCDIMEGSDVCFAPILNLEESIKHPHNVARETFVEIGGISQPAPAPRFDRTPSDVPKPASAPGEDTEAVLSDWGFDADAIKALIDSKAVKQI